MTSGDRRRLVDQRPVRPAGRRCRRRARRVGPVLAAPTLPSSGRQDSIHWIRCTSDPSRAMADSTRAQAAIRASWSPGPSRAKLWPRTASTAVAVRDGPSMTTPTSVADDAVRTAPTPGSARRRPTASGPPAAGAGPGPPRRRRTGPRRGRSDDPVAGAGPGANCRPPPDPPDHTQRATRGSHCSPVRPRMGQNARATPVPTRGQGHQHPDHRRAGPQGQNPDHQTAATAAICPPRQPAITPRRSSGENRYRTRSGPGRSATRLGPGPASRRRARRSEPPPA